MARGLARSPGDWLLRVAAVEEVAGTGEAKTVQGEEVSTAINIFLLATMLLCLAVAGGLACAIVHDWGNVGPWSTYKAPGLAITAVVVIALVACVISHRLYIRMSAPQTFDQWFAEHEKTCSECGGDYSNGPPPLCEEAFTKLQDSLKQRN